MTLGSHRIKCIFRLHSELEENPVSSLTGSTAQPNITHLYCAHSYPQPHLEVCRDHKLNQYNFILFTFVRKLIQPGCWMYLKSKILLSMPQVHSNEMYFKMVKCKVCPRAFYMCVYFQYIHITKCQIYMACTCILTYRLINNYRYRYEM